MNDREKGSVELIVIGLLAALIIVLAIPLLSDIGSEDGAGARVGHSQL